MSSKNRILIVGDSEEILQLLRARLGNASMPVEATGVTSAEEALDVIRREPVKLLVTDLRMPGTGGLDLVRRARTEQPGLKSIILASRASYREVEQAAELGVARFFKKTMDRERLLAAVMDALGQPQRLSPGISPRSTMVKEPPKTGRAKVLPAVLPILEQLRVDTGSNHVVLSSLSGELLASTEGSPRFLLEQLIPNIAFTVRRSLQIAEQLGNEQPTAIQYIPGQKWDLYFANVGRESFLAIFSDTPFQRGRFGTLWVYAQRAVAELAPLLNHDHKIQKSRPQVSRAIRTSEEIVDTRVPSVSQENLANAGYQEMLSKAASREMEALLGDILMSQEDAVDLDAFWDEAVANETDNLTASEGISLEEALKKGILGSDFTFEE